MTIQDSIRAMQHDLAHPRTFIRRPPWWRPFARHRYDRAARGLVGGQIIPSPFNKPKTKKLYYCPAPDSPRCMEVDVPDDIGPGIGLGALVEDSGGWWITAIDYDAMTYTARQRPLIGNGHSETLQLPTRYYQVEGEGERCAVVARPGGVRYPFAWPKESR